MDNLGSTLGLAAHKRAKNVAKDPFAATQFFFFLANTVLETLFSFAIKRQTKPNTLGALGLGNTYFGVVEAQGCGSLHLHLVMWLRNSPNANEVTIALQSPEFREKIKAFLRANVRSHLDNLTDKVLATMVPSSELAWGRPPDPDSPTFKHDWKLLETKLARSQQYHVCTPNTCLQFNKRKGRTVCKRRAPFELSATDVVTEAGDVCTRRLIKQLNSWCTAVFTVDDATTISSSLQTGLKRAVTHC